MADPSLMADELDNRYQGQSVDEDGADNRRDTDGQGQKNIYAIARRSHVILVIGPGYEGSCKVRLITKPSAGTSASRVIDIRNP